MSGKPGKTTASQAKRPGQATPPGPAKSLLVAAILFVLPLLAWLAIRNPDSESRYRDQLRLGSLYELGRDYAAARKSYLEALELSPLSFEATVRLALLLDRRLGENAAAARYYRQALDLWGSDAGQSGLPDRQEVVDSLAVLDFISHGLLEDPWEAVADMLLAAESGAKAAFELRLDVTKLKDEESLWREWTRGGPSQTVGRRLFRVKDGGFAASVELRREDSRVDSLLFAAQSGTPWRLTSYDGVFGASP